MSHTKEHELTKTLAFIDFKKEFDSILLSAINEVLTSQVVKKPYGDHDRYIQDS